MSLRYLIININKNATSMNEFQSIHFSTREIFKVQKN